jgi:hypothetical protein
MNTLNSDKVMLQGVDEKHKSNDLYLNKNNLVRPDFVQSDKTNDITLIGDLKNQYLVSLGFEQVKVIDLSSTGVNYM